MEQLWILKRNCSLTPRQSALALAPLCAFVLAIGCLFAALGLWPILAFAVLDVAMIAAALVRYARHACDRERIALSPGCLLIEQVDGGQVRQVRLDPYWTRIRLPCRRRQLIELEARGVTVRVGGLVGEQSREQLALELRRHLIKRSLFGSAASP